MDSTPGSSGLNQLVSRYQPVMVHADQQVCVGVTPTKTSLNRSTYCGLLLSYLYKTSTQGKYCPLTLGIIVEGLIRCPVSPSRCLLHSTTKEQESHTHSHSSQTSETHCKVFTSMCFQPILHSNLTKFLLLNSTLIE